MKIVLFFLISIAALIVLGIISCIISAKLKSESAGRFVFDRFVLPVIIGVLIACIPVMLIAGMLRPQMEAVMPGFALTDQFPDVPRDEYGDPLVEDYNETIKFYTRRIEKTPTEADLYYRSWLYFRTDNVDLACNDLMRCYELNPTWEYAYNIGVCYSYMLKYDAALEYMYQSLDLSPPPVDRGEIVDNIQMIESYYYGWFYSIMGLN